MLNKQTVLSTELVIHLLAGGSSAEQLLFFFPEVCAVLEFAYGFEVVLRLGEVSTVVVTASLGSAP